MHASVKAPFQAVPIRYVHDTLTGEALNIGVVLVCGERKYAGARFLPSWSRITAAFPDAQLPVLRRLAASIEDACATAFEIAGGQFRLDVPTDAAELVGRVLPNEDASIQLASTIRGVTSDPAETLRLLADQFVLRYSAVPERTARQDDDVWDAFVRGLSKPQLVANLFPYTLKSPHLEIPFDHAWKNATLHIVEPLSFDLVDPNAVRDKATKWTGRLLAARPSDQGADVTFLVGLPSQRSPDAVRQAADDAVAILDEMLEGEARLLPETEASKLEAEIATDLEHHEP